MKPLKSFAVIVAAFVFADVNDSMADHVVLQSASESYAVGDLLPDSISILLSDGEQIVLLSELGDVINIVGPFNGQPTGSGADEFDLRTALSSLIENADNVHASLGSTRSGGIRLMPSDPRPAWTLDPVHSGAQCVLEGSEIGFWRTDAANELELVIQRPGFEGAVEIMWEAGESGARWPESVPVIHGELYVIRRKGWMESAIIHLAIVPATVANASETATAWLAVNGCKVQAEAMMQTVTSQDAAGHPDA